MLFPVHGGSLLVSMNLEQFGLKYLYPLPLRHVCNLGLVSSGFSLEVIRNYGVGKFRQEKGHVKEILWERKCMDFEV